MSNRDFAVLVAAIVATACFSFAAGVYGERLNRPTVDQFHEGMAIEMECLTSDVYFFPKKGVHQSDSDAAAHEFMRREGCLWINE